MKLYSYFRSSASYRVRIALNLKKIPHETDFVHLLKNGGEQRSAAYAALNPQKLVPALATEEGVFTQSLAIIEYLEETHPEMPLLPATAAERARVRAIAQLMACDIHPLNNLRVLQYLQNHLQADEAAKKRLVCPLDQRRLRCIGTTLAIAANRPLLPRRHPHAGRLLLSAASV